MSSYERAVALDPRLEEALGTHPKILMLLEDAMTPFEPNGMTSVPHGLVEAILGTASDAIIATDVGGCVSFWNPGATRIFGFTSKEAVGSSLDLIIPENLRRRHWMGYNRVMATGESLTARANSCPCQD